MDRAPLRPVPAPPSGPVADADAARLVAARLPALRERDAHALGLVTLAGRSRPEAARRLGLADDELPVALARARKQLRRTVSPLPGSGWCERAELLISDRLDGALDDRNAPRLDVHLRNCPRCVEHERRLVQATDELAAGVAPGPGRPVPAPVTAIAAAEPGVQAAKPARVRVAGPPATGRVSDRAQAITAYLLIALAVLLVIGAIVVTVAPGT
jgi:hypothetical protein